MMKLIFTAIVLISVPLRPSAQEKPLILSTASMIMDMSKNIGGDNFVYSSIVPIGSDPHLYEPTPGDVRKCNQAAVILKNGLTFEGWLQKLIDNSGSAAQVFTVTKGVVPIASEQYANATDPHAWMSAANGLLYCQNIRDAMIEVFPDRADEFRNNYQRYISQLEELDQYITTRIASVPEDRRILITSHDAFQYYGRRYKIQLESVLGTSTDADVQTSDVQRLHEVIRNSNVPVVFIESTINPRLISQIANDNNISVGGKLYADSLGEPEGPAGTYLKMLRYNTDVIFEGLMENVDPDHIAPVRPTTNWLWGLLLAPIVLAIGLFIFRVITNR